MKNQLGTGQIEDDGTPFVTTAQIVDALNSTPATITRWVAAGKLTPIHKGRGIRGAFLFDREEVNRFLSERLND